MVLSRGWSGRALVLLLLVAATGVNAQLAPAPAEGGNAQIKMLDARVNLKESYFNSLAARANSGPQGRQVAAQYANEISSAIASARVSMPGLDVDRSNLTAGPTSVRNTRGQLTTATGQSNQTAVRNFLNARGAIYGLNANDVSDVVTIGDSQGASNGLRMLRVEQVVANRAVFQSETRFTLDRNGRVVKSVGVMVPHARTIAPSLTNANLLDARTALSRLLAFEDRNVDLGAMQPTPGNAGRTLLVGDADYVAGEVTAREVWFPLAPGVLVPAWSLVVFTEGDADWYAVVDAETGDVLWRKNMRQYISAHDARFRVFVQADGVTPADSPAPQSPTSAVTGGGTQFPGIAPTIVSMHTAMDAVASQNGWIDDCPGGVCTANESQTLGNNVLACIDRNVGGGDINVCDTNAAGVLDGNGRPTGNPDANARNRDFLGTAPRDFQTGFLPPPQGGNPEAGQTATGNGASGANAFDQFRRGSVTGQFYVSNWYHDKLFALGFDEGSANFQQTNFSGNGLGADRVLLDVQDGNGTNNANFGTPPDGTSGRAQMFRFTGPTIDRDGGLDNEILLHELTHGTSNRLVGNAAGLNWDPAAGLGEGWSDFYALSLLNPTNADNPNSRFASGAYATYKLGGLLDNYVYGIRRFPYTTDNSINPMTWADVDDVTYSMSGGIPETPLGFSNAGGMEVHNSGEIWALTLWEARSRVIADPAGANGDVTTGSNTMLRIVTDAMKMTPINPSFVDARDALFDADCATNACANEASIWAGFADRGFGFGGGAPYNVSFGFTGGQMAFTESFSVPYLFVTDPAADVSIDDSLANNNGTIDPGEPVRLTVKLSNPWRAASKAVASATATLSTSTPGVTIIDNASTYGAIAPQGSATGDTFTILVANAALCGSRIDFTLTTTSNLGTTATTFSLRVGAASGTDPVVTYTKDTTPDLAVPDNRGRAVFDQLAITDDFVIADADLRIDSATHPLVGDLSFMLRSPMAIGSTQVGLIAGLTDGGGANLSNMVADDDVASNVANDMVQATAAGAPYTKSWLPVFNAPWPTLANFPAQDAVGTLSRLDGTSTLGTWSLTASDQFQDNVGTLNAWSILVTPVHFACTAFVGAPAITATKTVSGTFSVGGTVTYTITLTNDGTASQADNAGNEFTDTLPAGLTLVSVAATSGTASSAGNIAHWNGALALLGGTTTITITATVDVGQQGSTLSNQGTVSFDADGNGTNESSLLTDDPGVGGATDPTAFVVAGAQISGTKTVAGTFSAGGTVTYTITLNNGGNSATTDNPGNEFTDVLPASLTLVSASASSGTAVATIGTNTVTWNGAIAAMGSSTITIVATINAVPFGTSISNQGAISYDADLNGSNESSAQTDDPGVGGAADPTTFSTGGAVVSGTKTVAGTFSAGGTVTYTVTLNNTGNSATLDNVGNEFSDLLPASLTLVSASSSSGTAVATIGTNTVTWNGVIAAAGSSTITIVATVNAVPFGTSISNQGAISYDADLNGSNETSASTDDPGLGGASDPTAFTTVGTLVSGTKSVAGTFDINNAIVYTIVLTNSGNVASPDNVGDELTDALPTQLTLVSAAASSGAALATLGTNTVTWNGTIPAGGSVTITINANIDADAGGQTVSNQGAFVFDANVDGNNESSGVTDDTGLAGAADPTVFNVTAAVQIPVPFASNWTLALLALGMLAGFAWQRRRISGF